MRKKISERDFQKLLSTIPINIRAEIDALTYARYIKAITKEQFNSLVYKAFDKMEKKNNETRG
jgi:hypothetical protein